jgi:colanic acid biosynthesis glycosyl transferase WcaI
VNYVGAPKNLMRILILSQQYWPEPITKAGELAEGLAAAGHEVTALTGFPNYPDGNLYPGYKLKPWSIQPQNGVRIIRTYLLPSPSKKKFRYMTNLATFTATASVLGPMLSKSVDVIYVRHPPLTQGVPALILKYLKRAPLVYAMHDLWPESIAALGVISNGMAIGALDRFERFLMRRADIVGLSSPGFVPNITGKGIPESKIRLLPDWVDERVYFQEDPDPSIAAQFDMNGKFNIVFAGNIGFAQNLDAVLDAAKLMRSSLPDVNILVLGGGLEYDRLKARTVAESISNVNFAGPVSPKVANKVFQLADGLLVHLRPGFIADISIASKAYSYMAVGKPILMGSSGTSKEMVEQDSIGITFEPGNPESLVQAVVKLQSTGAEERVQMGERGKTLFHSKYSRAVGIRQHEELFEELVRSRK